MSSSDSPAGQVVTQANQAPWEGRQPFDLDILNEAQNIYRTARPTFFPNQAVVPQAAATTQALGAQEQRALTGSPLRDAAIQQGQSTLRGDYLDTGNPFTQNLIDRYNATAGAALDSQFMKSKGGYGSEGHIEARARGLGQAVAQPLFDNYERERARQFGMTAVAPDLAATDYSDIARLEQVGRAREELGQRQLQDQIDRHQFETNLPDTALRRYAGLVQGQPAFSSTTSTTPFFRNQPASILGGGIGGAQIGRMMGSESLLWPAAGAFLGAL